MIIIYLRIQQNRLRIHNRKKESFTRFYKTFIFLYNFLEQNISIFCIEFNSGLNHQRIINSS